MYDKAHRQPIRTRVEAQTNYRDLDLVDCAGSVFEALHRCLCAVLVVGTRVHLVMQRRAGVVVEAIVVQDHVARRCVAGSVGEVVTFSVVAELVLVLSVLVGTDDASLPVCVLLSLFVVVVVVLFRLSNRL